MELASAALVSPVCVVSPGELLSSNVAEEEDIASYTADNLRVGWCPEMAWARSAGAGSAPATAHQQRVSAQVIDTCYWESCWVYVVYVCACR